MAAPIVAICAPMADLPVVVAHSGGAEPGRFVPKMAVNTGVGYHVFLTPLGDRNGLYVASRGPSSFKVRELAGGASGIAFDCRVVAQRLGSDGMRLDAYQQRGTDGEELPTAPSKGAPREVDDN